MKINISTIVLLGILGITPLGHAETSPQKTSIAEVKQETEKLLKTLNAYTTEQKDEAIRKTQAALEKLDKRIDTLEDRVDDKWDAMDKNTRKKARKSLKTIHRHRNQLAQWYGSLENSTESTWEQMKKGFSNAYKALDEAWVKSENEIDANESD